jgi:Flp pilus assembly protein TadD
MQDKAYSLALQLYREKRFEEAIRSCRKILRRKPSNHMALSLLAHSSLDMGKLGDARETAERLVSIRPVDAHGWNLLGRILIFSGEAEAAKQAIKKATQLDPQNPWAWFQLGLVAKILSEADMASEAFCKAFELAPQEIAIRYNHALGLIENNQAEEAESIVREALDDGRGPAELEHALGMSLLARNRIYEAIRHLRESVKRHPNHADLKTNLGSALDSIRERHDALEQFKKAAELKPKSLVAHRSLFKSMMRLGYIEEARRQLEVLAEIPGYDENPTFHRATINGILGNHEDAINMVEPYFDSAGFRLLALYIFGRSATKTGRTDEAIDRIKQAIAEYSYEEVNDNIRDLLTRLDFTLGSLLDNKGDYEAAFEAFHQGNVRRHVTYERNKTKKAIDRLIDFYTKNDPSSLPRASLRTNTPIFIVGMPRSGTSLLEQMLDSHPQIYGAGELTSISTMTEQLALDFDSTYPDYTLNLTQEKLNELAGSHVKFLHKLAGHKVRVTDKLPMNYNYLGFISQLFPDARIIHCRRTPEATALSIFFQDFAQVARLSYANNIEDIGFHYRQYLRVLEFWSKALPITIHHVDYEDVVNNPESTTQALCEYLAIPWDPAMLQFHKSKRIVVTASNLQVQEKLYNSALSNWEHYTDQLKPFSKEISLPLDTA